MKIEVIHNFYDKENNLKLRKVGDKYSVSKERGKYLITLKVAKEIQNRKAVIQNLPLRRRVKRLIFMPEGLKLRGDTGLTTVHVRHT